MAGYIDLMAVEQTVISRYTDPDFGVLEFVETRTQARLNGGPWKSVIFREWSGKREDPGVTVGIADSEDPPVVADEIRNAFRAVVADTSEFKRVVAQRMLRLAEEWARQGKLSLPLDLDTFSDLPTISSFSIGDSRLTVFFERNRQHFRRAHA